MNPVFIPNSNSDSLTPTGLNSTFPCQDNLPFAEYIHSTRKLLEKTRLLNSHPPFSFILNANSPFQWYPANHANDLRIIPKTRLENGVLLIHGLLDSPFSMRDLGKYFLKKNFLVRSILLPGHGSRPGDLIQTHVNEWIKACQYGMQSLINEVNNVYVVGLSGGATLALYHALSGMPIKKLILISPAVQLKNRWIRLSQILRFHHKFHPSAWYKICPENDYSKYESVPYNLVYQAYHLTKVCQKLRIESKLKVPVFMAISQDDETVSSKAAIDYFKETKHPQSKLLVYDRQIQHPKDIRIEYRSSYFPHRNIVSFSHICLHISPTNPHYGIHGDYQAPLLYGNYPENLAINKTSLYYGALPSKADPAFNYPIQRLTYNPDFNYLMSALDEFLAAE